MGFLDWLFGKKQADEKKPPSSTELARPVVAQPAGDVDPPATSGGKSPPSSLTLRATIDSAQTEAMDSKQQSTSITTAYRENDNIGARHDTRERAKAYWLGERLNASRKDPFLMYLFSTANDAERALLELPYIHRAQDSQKLICTEVLFFGFYEADPETQAKVGGKYETSVGGDALTYDMWEQARSIFVKNGGRKKNELEPSRDRKTDHASSTVDLAQIEFLREDRESSGIYKIYKGPNAATATAFLKDQSVNRAGYFVVVETPDGNYCRDSEGIYKEA